MLAVVTNLPGWRVASPASDLEKAPDADWPLYPTTLPVLPVMFGPNITGQFQAESWNITGRQGAFYIRKKSLGGASGSDGEAHEVSLDSSYSSSVYGRSSTVQPSALRLIPCIKI